MAVNADVPTAAAAAPDAKSELLQLFHEWAQVDEEEWALGETKAILKS